jgi:hypothetical protein
MNDAPSEFRPIDRSQHELLVVDDEPASRYATVRQLRSAGFRTREVATGTEALAAIDDSISAMVIDVHLPDIDGFELCHMLRSRPETTRMPVLHLTAAYVTDEDKVRGLDSGADAYLTRPVEPAVLVATVQALVRTRVAEEAMRTSEARFRAIYAHAPGGIALLDESGRFIDANPAMLALLSRDRDAVIGRSAAEFVPPDWTARVEAYSREVSDQPTTHEFPVLTPDGQTTHVEWSFSSHADPSMRLAVATDMSQRVQLEDQRQQLLERERAARGAAEQVNRMKDEFIAVLSHELRTPLNVINGWTHVLKRRGGNPETMHALDAIERNVAAQARLISDLLDMSRLNTGKLQLTMASLDPHDLVQSAVHAMRTTLDENANELVLDLQPPYRPLHGDASRLQQVIWNLLGNAIKFSPRGGKIRVALREAPDALTLRISDEGQGIAPGFLSHVFEPFAQSDALSTRSSGGLGLGLSIVRQLVEAHGGTVTAESEGLGKGATFEIRLPLDTGPDPAQGSGDEEEVTLEGRHLLVVEDDPEANAMLQIILSDRGALVKSAYDCDGALEILETLRPDLLISDIGMPGKDGYEMMREIRRREAASGRHLPAIALTSFTRDQDERQALEAGFDAHSAKPIRPLKLVQLVRELLQRADFRPSL